MKKILSLILTTIIVISAASCKKDISGQQQKINETIVKPEIAAANVTQSYKDIATIIITTAKNNNEFRLIAYKECLKQKYGDYYVKLNELIKLNATHKYWDDATIAKVTDLEKSIIATKRNDVIIFIPSLERFPEKAFANRLQQRTEILQDPIAVIGDEYNNPTQTCPGYIVESNAALTFIKL